MAFVSNRYDNRPLERPYRRGGCICGKDVRHEGTCIFCGHGLAEYTSYDHAYQRVSSSNSGSLDARVVPIRKAPSHEWDEDSCVTAYRAWERQYERPPTSTDWQAKREPGEHRPTYHIVRELFGGWKAFLYYVADVPREQVAA